MKKIPQKLNRLSKTVISLRRWPKLMRTPLLNFIIHRTVKFTGTASLDIEILDFNRATMVLKNRKKVQNHIGTIHATAMALLAETATGMVVGMNIPDDRVPVLKSMQIQYLKRAVGDMKACSRLLPEQIAQMRTEMKGETLVEVVVTDEENKEPIQCQMIWAWTPKRRVPASE